MSNHYHLVIETPEANLAQGIRQLNGVYTRHVNRTHERVGHVFQGRYRAIVVEKDACLLELARYVVLNPVRAQMVGGLRQWPWSSYRAMIGVAPAPVWLETDWILGQFGSRRSTAAAKYVDFVRAGVGLPSIWDNLQGQIYLGGEAFVERIRRLGLADSKPEQLAEIPRAQRRRSAKPLSYDEKKHSERTTAMAQAYVTGDYSLQQIAYHFGVYYSTVSRGVRDAAAALLS